ncbi:MAG: GNVR domain-containing protein [candidate division WOR-3 bacterium]
MNRVPKYLGVILKWRRLIVINVLGLSLITYGITWLLPKRWTAVAQILPPSEESDPFGLSQILGTGLGSSLSRLRLGAIAGAGTVSDVMAGIIDSRTVMQKVAEQCSLAWYYRIKPSKTELLVRQLREMTRVKVGDEGILQIAVEAKTPHLAAKLANSFIAQLDSFLRSSNMSRGRNMRVFLEHRLAEVESTLALAQESLQAFQSRHKVVALDEETKAAIDAYARLKSQVYLKQAELEVVQGVASADNPYEIGLRRELTAYQEQLRQLERGGTGRGFGVGFGVAFERLPAVGAEFARRYRDYKIQEETYAMLYQQFEYAKVLEARDAPTITVLDYAVPPQKRSYPRRTLITAVVFVFSLVASLAFAFIMEYFEFLRQTKPDEFESWRAVWTQLSAAFRGLVRIFSPKKKR